MKQELHPSTAHAHGHIAATIKEDMNGGGIKTGGSTPAPPPPNPGHAPAPAKPAVKPLDDNNNPPGSKTGGSTPSEPPKK